MRILLIASSYPPVLGGLQTVVRELAVRLTSLGHEVRVITNRYPRSLPAREVRDGVRIDRYLFLLPSFGQLAAGRFDLFLASLIVGPLTRHAMRQAVVEFKPDVVNVHFPLAQNSFVLWLRTKYRFPLVVSLHGNEILAWYGANARPYRGVEQRDPKFAQTSSGIMLARILKAADGVTACSNWLLSKAAGLEESVGRKGRAIHNGIEPERFADKTAPARTRPYIFSFGRLTELKGFDMLIAAFAGVASDFPEIDLVIAGDGEENRSLYRLAAEQGLETRIYFVGRLGPEAVVRHLNGCRFLVVPSRCEPFGIVAVEGLAAGKAVLAADAGGLSEIPGIRLVPPTVDGLRGGMQNLLTHPVGTAVTEPAAFDWQHAVTAYVAVFESALSKNRA